MLPENIIYIGVVIDLIGSTFYLKSIVYGSTKPNLVSWVIWMLAPFIGVFFQIKAGAGLSFLPVFMSGFGPLCVVLLSDFSKNTYWKITTFDIYCGTLALLALMFYVFTHNLGISIFFAILSDFLAAIPTVIKSWKFPKTESYSIYFVGILVNIFGLLTIKNWIFPIYSFSVYIILMNSIIIFSIFRNKIFRTKIIS
jgi:hypothetical protein